MAAHGDRWHLAYLAVTPPGSVGGIAVFDVTVPRPPRATSQPDAGEHRNLTAGMTVCPVELAQVAAGPPLALFADGLDTAIYRLDPGTPAVPAAVSTMDRPRRVAHREQLG